VYSPQEDPAITAEANQPPPVYQDQYWGTFAAHMADREMD